MRGGTVRGSQICARGGKGKPKSKEHCIAIAKSRIGSTALIDYKKEKIRLADIDFSKYGWVQKVSEILNITPQKVNRWMRNNMKDEYEKSFKRKRKN